MAETRRRHDPDFRAGAIRIVNETGKSCADVARDLGINETTLATWVSRDRAAKRQAVASGLGESEEAELARLRRENAELRMERVSSSVRPVQQRTDGWSVASHGRAYLKHAGLGHGHLLVR